MRETKSRALSMCKGERWVYGDLRHYNRNPHTEKWTIHDPDTGLETDIDERTVGQYTGLHDRKDREIYEGDILFVEFSDKSGGYYLVGWNDKTAAWGIMDRYEYRSIHDGYDFAEFKNHTLLAFFKEAIIFEVAGNIHDNPELMNIPKAKK